MDNYIVYVKTDEQSRITAINSSAFLADITGWVEIDQGDGDRYHHAQGNYLPLPLITDEGAYRYKLVDGEAVERTIEEMATDVADIPVMPTQQERIEAAESAIMELAAMLSEVL